MSAVSQAPEIVNWDKNKHDECAMQSAVTQIVAPLAVLVFYSVAR